MKPLTRADCPRPALSIAMALITLSGCATQSSSVQPSAMVPGKAPDLLNVSAVAPPINPDVARTAANARASASPSDTAVTSASVKPEAPTLPPVEPSRAQEALKPSAFDENAGLMGPAPPVAATAEATPASIPQAVTAFPIDLSTALRLADGQNPTIGEARTLILGALAERQAARSILLPSLNMGTNYHDHTGPLQRSNGQILKLTEQSLYFGGGAGVTAAGTLAIPMVNIFSPLTNAIYEPLAAQQRLVGAQFNASDTANKVLLEVASLYIDLIGAEATLQARRVTAIEADKFASIVADYAATGQGRQADANRADSDRRFYQADIQRAEEQVAIASAKLAQRLNLNPSAQLKPLAGPLEPLDLINAEIPAEELIRNALARRPDLAAQEALVAQAGYRVKEEKARPLLPTIYLGFSAGAFGGGSNLTSTPLSGFAGRTDYDVGAYWTLLNLGAGNGTLIKQRRAQEGQAIADRARVLNRVRSEVVSAKAQSLALRSQVTNARFGLQSAEEGYLLDRARLRESLARPIEALDSLRLLSDARVSLIEAVTRANRAQFALFVSLGAPPPLDTPPIGPGPATSAPAPGLPPLP